MPVGRREQIIDAASEPTCNRAFGVISTGAADDLIQVTDIAHAMVLRDGMSDPVENRCLRPHSLLIGCAAGGGHSRL